MNARVFRWRWIAPLIFFQGYLGLSVLLFFFGPWPWDVDNPRALAGYLLSAQVFIAIGYLLAWPQTRRLHNSCQECAWYIPEGIKFLKYGLVISLVLVIPTSMSTTGSFLPNVFFGLSETGLAYNQNVERLVSGNTYVVVNYVRMFVAPLLVAVFPLTVVYWSKLTRDVKLLCVVVIFFQVSQYVATGTNKGVADFVITLPLLLFLGNASGILRIRLNRSVIALGCVTLFMVFLVFFGAGQAQRTGGVGELGVMNTGFEIIEADRDHFVWRLLSDNLSIAVESLVRYLCHGYYALSLSFDIEHTSTFGLGHSMFLARNADFVSGTTFFTQGSIPAILENETGWGMFGLWHSIYPWIASDVGFVGALFVMGLFGYLLGLSWGRSLLTLSAKWLTFMYLMLILFLYIPANNQVFQSGEGLFAFALLSIGLALQAWTKRQLTRDT